MNTHQSDVPHNPTEARRWFMGGRVQGVGYRAFVFNLALDHGLCGVVQNLTGEVLVEAQGKKASLDAFANDLVQRAPMFARPVVVSCTVIPLRALTGFVILPSAASAHIDIHVPPDSFLCKDCRREMLDSTSRRYRYPFTNCTQCGPRYTLITAMPYDRPNTTMADFQLCPDCRREYDNPHDRRFHAQPLACPTCGPKLSFHAPDLHTEGEAALQSCLAALARGDIVAVKGIGGYHLMCDALNQLAIANLRISKHRPDKPLAIMYPWEGDDGLQRIRLDLMPDKLTSQALVNVARPIVLIQKNPVSILPESIAPGLNDIGVMLPYSPLHDLLLTGFGSPLIATSGNISGEPVLTDDQEVENRLGKVAQAYLHHDRHIARPVDDSVVRIVADQERLIRVGRGIAPLEFDLPFNLPAPILAVGGHMKNAIALAWNNRMVLSPHIGDLGSLRSMEVFERVITDLQRLYGITAETLVCDAHAGYASSQWALKQSLPVKRIYHHQAHASALAWEYGLEVTRLTFTWDGVGMGQDGTLWGGEALLGKPGAWQRVASFKPFRLPGGERAGREPWRSAAGVCWEAGLDWHSEKQDTALVRQAWQKGLNSPHTSAAGRLFDAASAILGLCNHASFEGQGPMLLEAAAKGDENAVDLSMEEDESGMLIADWTPLFRTMLDSDLSVSNRAMQFHQSLAHSILQQTRQIYKKSPFDAVGLTGGVFQNKLLTEITLELLTREGYTVDIPQQIPCNDGGLAIGQLIEASFQHG